MKRLLKGQSRCWSQGSVLRTQWVWSTLQVTVFALVSFSAALWSAQVFATSPSVLQGMATVAGKQSPVSYLSTSYFHLQPAPLMDPDGIYQKAILAQQTPYFSPLAGYENRAADPISGDQVGEKLWEGLDYLISLTSFIGVPQTPSELAKSNQTVIEEVMNDVRKDPAKYGLTARHAEKLDITHIPLEFLNEAVMNSISHEAGWWGGILATAFVWLLDQTVNMGRAWSIAMLQSMGVELAVTAASVQFGMKQLYVMHRLYSHMRGVKAAKKLAGEHFDPEEVMVDFSRKADDLIVFDELFKRDIYKGWMAALVVGSFIKSWTNRPIVRRLVWSDRSFALISRTKFMARNMTNFQQIFKSMTYVAKRVRSFFGGADVSAKGGGEGWKRLSVEETRKSRLFFKSLKAGEVRVPEAFKDRPFNEIAKAMREGEVKTQYAPSTRTVFTPFIPPRLSLPSLSVTLVDFGLTYVSMRYSIYALLNYSSQLISYTYLSPGTNVEMALFDEDLQANADFIQGTREVFYPTCAYLASEARYYQAKDEGLQDRERQMRKQGCLRLIKFLEGIETDQAVQKAVPITASLIDSGPTTFSEELLTQKLERARSYPAEFRVTWLAMLRSIFPIDSVPSQYWTLKYRMIDNTYMVGFFGQLLPRGWQKGWQKWWDEEAPSTTLLGWLEKDTSLSKNLVPDMTARIFETNIAASVEEMNLERLNYAVEYLAVHLAMERLNKTLPKDQQITDIKDDRLVPELQDLTGAMIRYMQHRKHNVIESNLQMLKVHRQKGPVKSGLGGYAATMWDSVGDIYRHVLVQQGITLVNLPPESRNWRNRIKTDIGHLVQNSGEVDLTPTGTQ